MNRMPLFFFGLCLLLAGCGSIPPTPTDSFYRLQPVSLPTAGKAFSGDITVQPLRADSLYSERPIVYSEASSLRQLRQYHYHLWLYPPAQLVQRHLAASLGSAPEVAGASPSANVIEGRIVSFERVVSGKNSKAVASLELRLLADGKARVNKTYLAEQSATGDSLGAFAVAMEQALGSIYAEFLADVDISR